MSGVGLALGALSCAAVVSFDDCSPRATPPKPPEPAPRYFVRANVTGLDDAEVHVVLGADSVVESGPLPGGPFLFPQPEPDAGLLDGTRFSVRVVSHPLRRFCAPERPAGHIDGGDAVGIDIACSRAEPELTGLTFRLCEREPLDSGTARSKST